MKTIIANTYSVFFNEEGFQYLSDVFVSKSYSKIFVLVDENTNQHCLTYFLSNIATEITIEVIEIESGETFKNIETCSQLWHALTELEGDRKSILLNLGGGVITDIGGFVACTFKRGIDFINIPTTLLGMVDASIGGKNGVDLGNLKNQIGIIKEPKAVIIITSFLETLPQKEMRSGLAEMLKHGLIYDVNYWNQMKNLNQLTTNDLDQLIHRSITIKNEIVSQDLTEYGIRKTLNFGHTIGHAIESFYLERKDIQILHGEAIAAGMIIESHISFQKKMISNETYQEIKYIIKDVFETLPIPKTDISQIIELLIYDKKNEFGKIQFALLNKIGNCIFNQEAETLQILSAFEDYIV